jgi:hypothetical protein
MAPDQYELDPSSRCHIGIWSYILFAFIEHVKSTGTGTPGRMVKMPPRMEEGRQCEVYRKRVTSGTGSIGGGPRRADTTSLWN